MIAPRVAGWIGIEAAGIWRAPHLGPAALGRVAERRLRRLLEAASRVPLHAARLAAIPPGTPPHLTLGALPPLGKAPLLAAGDAALLGGRVRSSWYSTRSSGSTGEPFRVHYDPRGWAILKYLVKARARWLCGLRPRDRIAIVDAPSEAGHVPDEGRSGRVRLVSALQSPRAIAEALQRFSPSVLYGLPSVLAEVAGELGGGLRVPAVFTSGELLSTGLRSRLTEAYGGRVYDVYGTTETKEVAWECPQGNRHVNADVLLVEILDDAGQPVPGGEEGRITITVLVNAAMPLLRYQPGDRGRLEDGRCDCGVQFPVLGVESGREVEYLHLGDGIRLSPYQLTCAVERASGVGRYQIIQVASRLIEVRATALPGVDGRRLEEQICTEVMAVIPVPVEIRVELVEVMKAEPGRKLRVVHALPEGS